MTEKVNKAPAVAVTYGTYFLLSVETNMSSNSEVWKRSLFGSESDGYGQCCPPVFDPYTLLALIGGIALATYFLRLVIINTVFNPPPRRRSLHSYVYGEHTFTCYLNISYLHKEGSELLYYVL